VKRFAAATSHSVTHTAKRTMVASGFHGVTAATIAAGISAMTCVVSMSLNQNAF
jgi:hypothetical protein